MSRPTLIRQLLRWQALTMGAAWLLLALWLTNAMMRLENGDLDRRMTYFAQILAETATAESSPEALARRLQSVEKIFVAGVIEALDNASHYDALYQVFDRDGKLLYHSPGTPAESMILAPGVHEMRLGGDTARVARVVSTDGRVTVVLAEPLVARRASILPMLMIIGGGQMLIFVVCIFVIWWSARRGLAPLRTLAASVSARSPGDLRPIDSTGVFQEVEPMIAAMNDLLRREGERLDVERGFLADAAHELRTPLAAIGAQAHLLMHASDPEVRRTALKQLQGGMERASHLLSQLLTIARLEAGRVDVERVRLDVGEIIRARAADFAPKARARSIEMSVEAPESLLFDVSHSSFVSVVDNLLDNAIRYTPSGGSVSVSASLDGGSLVFAVRDDGPGVPQAYREKVFERFFRIPGSTESGSGLGLSIVRKIIAAHGATVELARGLNEHGLGVVVKIPSASG